MTLLLARLPILVPIIGVVATLLGAVVLFLLLKQIATTAGRGTVVVGRVVAMTDANDNPVPGVMDPGFTLTSDQASAIDKQMGKLYRIIEYPYADGSTRQYRQEFTMPTSSQAGATKKVWYDAAHPERPVKLHDSPLVMIGFAVVCLAVGILCLALTVGWWNS